MQRKDSTAFGEEEEENKRSKGVKEHVNKKSKENKKEKRNFIGRLSNIMEQDKL